MPQHAIQFTQEQARALLDITPGTMRHWRSVVPYLAERTGKSARFSITDLIGLAIVSNLIRTYGVHIAQIADAINNLFFQLRDRKWGFLQNSIAVVTPTDGKLYSPNELNGLQIDGPILVVPCDPIIQQIQLQFVPVTLKVFQHNLPFAPQVIEATK